MHPAGPLWEKKDTWSIPKGELDESEDHIVAAKREFEEEVGVPAPTGGLIDLGIMKSGSKTNFVWAVEGEVDLSNFKSNTFAMEWPPKSGIIQEYPEVDHGEWFDLDTAKKKLFKSQINFINRLAEHLQIELPSEAEQQSLL